MNMFPVLSMAIPVGSLSEAEVAGPPSPENAWFPFPATVVIIPVPASTRRIRLFPVSVK
jgi:hypothetical protein